MSAANVYMGPRGNLVLVPAPAASPDYTPVGWSAKTQYLNGGVGVKTSRATHKEYALTWNATTRDRIRPIMDIYSGMLGTGLIYYCDPVALDANVMPQGWAFPALASLDGPVLISTGANVTRPAAIATPANTLGYPATSVAYAAGTATSLFVPILPGYVLWFGWHGSGTGGVQITPAVSATVSAAAVFPAALLVTDPTRFNASFAGSSYVGVDISLVGGGSVFSGLIAHLLPVGVTPSTGGFVSGQGNSGCSFETAPTMTPYVVANGMDLVGASGKLIEVGSWL
ncbi:hypothetical protein [Frigoribacterium sp. UYMn621]|uniref:hypothetical protein n=1 Tax=Frigoribacterium sp. UYMn621 TaxID=3156343 RepID=UPI003393898E